MRCTECRTKSKRLIFSVWSSEHGQIVGKNERLCFTCANMRNGYSKVEEECEKIEVKMKASELRVKSMFNKIFK